VSPSRSWAIACFFKYVYEKGVAYRSWFYMKDRMGQSSAQNEMGVTPSNFTMASTGVLGDFGDLFGKPVAQADLKRSTDKLLSRWYLGAQRPDQSRPGWHTSRLRGSATTTRRSIPTSSAR
jgi:hypothetical protein